MEVGTVKWFNNRKGYGFILPEDGGEDIFVHITALEEAGLKTLHEEEKVQYVLGRSKGKIVAKDLVLLDRADGHGVASNIEAFEGKAAMHAVQEELETEAAA